MGVKFWKRSEAVDQYHGITGDLDTIPDLYSYSDPTGYRGNRFLLTTFPTIAVSFKSGLYPRVTSYLESHYRRNQTISEDQKEIFCKKSVFNRVLVWKVCYCLTVEKQLRLTGWQKSITMQGLKQFTQ